MRILRIMTVCGFGLGTSLVLKMTLDEVLAQNNIRAETFCSDADTALGQTFDLVLTSRDLVKLFADQSAQVVVVDHFLSLAEVQEKVVPAVLALMAD